MSWKNKYMLVYTNQKIPTQPPELEYGNTEYKIFLAPRIKKRNRKDSKLHAIYLHNFIQNKSTQMLFRLLEGKGKALYLLGIEDNGAVRGMNQEEMQTSLKNIKLMAHQIGANIRIIRVYNGGIGNVCTVRIVLPENIYFEKVKNSIV